LKLLADHMPKSDLFAPARTSMNDNSTAATVVIAIAMTINRLMSQLARRLDQATFIANTGKLRTWF